VVPVSEYHSDFWKGGFNDSLFIRGLRLGKTTALLLERASL
jgi:hypothetical protein